ncbi:MAG TPA: hypothetical protein VGD29_15420 [Actinoplanes sp.]
MSDTDLWFDDVCVTDSTRSSFAVGVDPGYCYCASHSRFFWGVRLHLIVRSMVTSNEEERQVLTAALDHDALLFATGPGKLTSTDKGLRLGRTRPPAGRPQDPIAAPFITATGPRASPCTWSNPSANSPRIGQQHAERPTQPRARPPHHRRRPARVAQRILALTAAIWHNRATGEPVTRSPTAYDH